MSVTYLNIVSKYCMYLPLKFSQCEFFSPHSFVPEFLKTGPSLREIER